ncbi:hypothetical protein Tco_1221412 [Tanacetum coccineum]
MAVKSHYRCDRQKIINLCFADDLFIFARGTVESATVVWDALKEFKHSYGLVPSIPKSEMKRGRAKVAWETVCKPKSTRGLVPSVYSEACLSYVVGYQSEIEDAKPLEAMGCLEYGADTFGNGLFAPRFEDVVEFLIPSSKERNARLFKKKSKSHTLIYETIITNVRLKLISIRFKNNTRVREMLATWKLPSYLVMYDDRTYGLHAI